jgi:diguanylate cyclase (GGDEF)-like protein
MEAILRLQINVLCLAVIAILWLSGDRRVTSKSGADQGLFRALLLSTAAMLASDGIEWYFDGKAGSLSRAIVLLSGALYNGVHTIPLAFFVLYADFQIFRDDARFKLVSRPLMVIAALVALAAAISPFTGILFYANQANRYARGPWFPAFAFVQFGLIAFVLGDVIVNRKRLGRRLFITLLAYPIPMLVAAIVQALAFGLILIWPTTTLFLVVAASNIEKRRSKTDYLTGTANRRSLDEELERRIALRKSGRALFGMLIDIDAFKAINDRFGHDAGDRALEDVARVLTSSVRVEDCVARMGGDEFVVLVDSRGPGAMEELVRRIECAVDNQNASNRRPYAISLSIGRAQYEGSEGAAGFLARLDADMYSRKKSTRG